ATCRATCGPEGPRRSPISTISTRRCSPGSRPAASCSSPTPSWTAASCCAPVSSTSAPPTPTWPRYPPSWRAPDGRWTPSFAPGGPIKIDVVYRAALLLVASNLFMTFAWYAHLQNMADRPWYVAALVSWGIALFEYLLQVPANRIGYTTLSLAQLKILQEVITLSVFVPFAIFYMRQQLRLDFLWAGLCLMGAGDVRFRGQLVQALRSVG